MTASRITTSALMAAAFLVFAPLGAEAAPEPTSKSAPQSAKEHSLKLFKEGAVQFKAGKMSEALALFEEAYKHDQNPTLLYNMARAHEALDEPDKAKADYERYLAASPDASDRGAVETRIAALQQQIAEREELANRREQPKPPPVEPPPPDGPSTIPWVVAGVGAAGLVTGAVFGILANGKGSDAEDEPVANQAALLRDDGQSFATGANIAFIAGGAIAAIGVTWGVIDLMGSDSTPTSNDAVFVALKFGFGQVVLEGKF